MYITFGDKWLVWIFCRYPRSVLKLSSRFEYTKKLLNGFYVILTSIGGEVYMNRYSSVEGEGGGDSHKWWLLNEWNC